MNLDSKLETWTSAGIIDGAAADRIRTWEREHSRSSGLRWPVIAALVFGALLLGAGVLLFVSAHWDELSPSGRMAVVVLMVGVFHLGGAAVAERFSGLSVALHTVGTVALGGGIALAGQIFHLSEHWPLAILLWAAGAALAWFLLRHWTQAALTALLAPWWLASEWWVWIRENRSYFDAPVATGICALSLAYLGARRTSGDNEVRKALGWLGGIALIPSAFIAGAERWTNAPPWQSQWIAWSIAGLAPVAMAVLLRRGEALLSCLAILWSLLLAAVTSAGHGPRILVYVWCAAGAIGLTAWGVRESRPERINLGFAGFAVTVLSFYFANVMDKLGRSASLIVIGLLFLAGGWVLERTRRQLLARL